jgi:FKBP-type peptidyl-prolyl cis-trans isomerase FkpA
MKGMTMIRRPTIRAVAVAIAAACLVAMPMLATAQPASAAAPAAAALTTPSGLVYKSVREGTGKSPGPTDSVKVNYRGTFPDGREFDSSYSRNEPAVFPLDHVIKCWTEAVQRMKPGGKAQLVCPPQIAYGARGAGGVIPPNATLNFEVELLEVNPH